MVLGPPLCPASAALPHSKYPTLFPHRLLLGIRAGYQSFPRYVLCMPSIAQSALDMFQERQAVDCKGLDLEVTEAHLQIPGRQAGKIHFRPLYKGQIHLQY